MEVDTIYKLFDIIMIGYGINGLYIWFQIKVKGAIVKKIFILPKDVSMEDCKDTEGFKVYISPRLLLISCLLILFGGFSLIIDFSPMIPASTKLMGSVIFVSLLFWLVSSIKNTIKKFW